MTTSRQIVETASHALSRPVKDTLIALWEFAQANGGFLPTYRDLTRDPFRQLHGGVYGAVGGYMAELEAGGYIIRNASKRQARLTPRGEAMARLLIMKAKGE